jgi:hypothetical protein
MTVVFRLTGTRLDGQWFEAQHIPVVAHTWGLDKDRNPTTPERVVFVPTGSVEWEGNACAEVVVPEDKLTLWKLEYHLKLTATL